MATKPETQMAALLRRQTTSHVFEIPEKNETEKPNKDTKNSITKEFKNVGNKEVKKIRNKEVKKSTNKETKKSRKTPNKTEMIRHAVNLTMCDDVKEALDILAVKKKVRPWKMLDKILRKYLKGEGMIG